MSSGRLSDVSGRLSYIKIPLPTMLFRRPVLVGCVSYVSGRLSHVNGCLSDISGRLFNVNGRVSDIMKISKRNDCISSLSLPSHVGRVKVASNFDVMQTAIKVIKVINEVTYTATDVTYKAIDIS